MPDPYREPDFRCEEYFGHKRCILEIGHGGMHEIPGGTVWVMAGDPGPGWLPGGEMLIPAGDSKEDEQ